MWPFVLILIQCGLLESTLKTFQYLTYSEYYWMPNMFQAWMPASRTTPWGWQLEPAWFKYFSGESYEHPQVEGHWFSTFWKGITLYVRDKSNWNFRKLNLETWNGRNIACEVSRFFFFLVYFFFVLKRYLRYNMGGVACKVFRNIVCADLCQWLILLILNGR